MYVIDDDDNDNPITNINRVLIKYIPQFIRLGGANEDDLYHIGERDNRRNEIDYINGLKNNNIKSIK